MEAGGRGLLSSVWAFIALSFCSANLSDGIRQVCELSEIVG
jgi:hypothetical protein